jgi:hypothetical protein
MRMWSVFISLSIGFNAAVMWTRRIAVYTTRNGVFLSTPRFFVLQHSYGVQVFLQLYPYLRRFLRILTKSLIIYDWERWKVHWTLVRDIFFCLSLFSIYLYTANIWMDALVKKISSSSSQYKHWYGWNRSLQIFGNVYINLFHAKIFSLKAFVYFMFIR